MIDGQYNAVIIEAALKRDKAEFRAFLTLNIEGGSAADVNIKWDQIPLFLGMIVEVTNWSQVTGKPIRVFIKGNAAFMIQHFLREDQIDVCRP